MAALMASMATRDGKPPLIPLQISTILTGASLRCTMPAVLKRISHIYAMYTESQYVDKTNIKVQFVIARFPKVIETTTNALI